jgi:hypothetical protein
MRTILVARMNTIVFMVTRRFAYYLIACWTVTVQSPTQ